MRDHSRPLRVSITVSIFGAMLFAALPLAITLSWYSISSLREAKIVAAKEIMERSAATVEVRLEGLVLSAETLAETIASWPEIDIQPGAALNNERPLSLFKDFPHISTVNIGYDDGSFYMFGSARTRGKDRLRQISAPHGTAFVEQSIFETTQGARVQKRQFVNELGEIIKSTWDEQPEYDPRGRPWYLNKSEGVELHKSTIYRFAGTDEIGLTISRRHPTGTVGVDLTLEQLGEFLRDEPQAEHGVLAIVTATGEVFASSATNETRIKILRSLLEGLSNRAEIYSGTINANGQQWILRSFPAPLSTSSEELLILAEPVSIVAASVNEIGRNFFFFTTIIVLASIPVIWWVSQALSRPLLGLVKDADSVRRFDLEPVTSDQSMINEIYELQNAMTRMRTALMVFAQYVPRALVKKLMQRDELPKLGGEKRYITVMFLDLENFTAMSSCLGPEELMLRMTQYFEAITQVLLANGATIDKYIGDAIMAFWNAPEEIEDHEHLACKTALEIRDVATAVTKQWLDAPKPLRTRIGIHCGEAVIGNVGSSDRMNYTALGATVNLAARLETLNRNCASDILVSENVYEFCQMRFEFKFISDTELKGFSDHIKTYSLISRKSQAI